MNTWTTNGPEGGLILALAIDPATPATLYAGNDSGFAGTDGGVFKSTDAGGSWTAIHAGLPAARIPALAISPSAPATLYAGTIGGGVFKSTNAGGSWTAINTGLTFPFVSVLAIAPSAPATIYAGTTGSGVFKSTNAGGNWTAINTGLPSRPWLGIPIQALAVSPSGPSTLYAVTLGDGVFKSTNAGGSWTAVNTGLPASVSALAIDPSDSDTLYAGTNDGVFKSTNAGGSWTAIDTGLTDPFASVPAVTVLAIAPSAPTTLYAGTVNFNVFKSTNAGGNWTAINAGLTDRVKALAVDPSNPARLYAGTDRGVFDYEGIETCAIGPEFQVNTNPAAALVPHLASDASGNFVVLWNRSEGPPVARRFDSSGTPLGGEFLVSSDSHGVFEAANAIAMNAAGDFVVFLVSFARLEGNRYRDADGFLHRFDSAGNSLGPDLPVNSYTIGDQAPTGAAMDAAGNFVVVWQGTDQDGMGVMARQFDQLGVPRGPEFQVNTYTTGGQSAAGVALDGQGGFVVVWNSSGQDGSGWGIFGRRFDSSGSPVSEEFPVNAYTTGSQFGPRIASTPAGDFIVTWTSEEQDGDGLGVFGRQFDSLGAPRGSEFQVNTYTSGAQNMYEVGANSLGDFVVVWQSLDQDGDGYGVFGQRLDRAGHPVGSEFQANTSTTGFQGYPSVGLSDDGSFPMAWLSETPNGQNVFARVGQGGVTRGQPLPVQASPRNPRSVEPRPQLP